MHCKFSGFVQKFYTFTMFCLLSLFTISMKCRAQTQSVIQRGTAILLNATRHSVADNQQSHYTEQRIEDDYS
ncbi:hypothetical protein T4B_10551 [Trichinella pseudospiralis]|uniref:Uncharacterized protein n=1 Tax=Trichinella pseudospiralis TaxID=6337 RepID=A0A0V1JR09_TRIPS|nr:hypothetical protein T4A_10035 [Trichinella pseudospiralis]KRZ11865.1 hypothetical protein T4B_10551 [Trichinella pseudospiralis]KRZ37380.1 hypothetical protein T4C_8502 [Trichinella pseudospiralis]